MMSFEVSGKAGKTASVTSYPSEPAMKAAANGAPGFSADEALDGSAEYVGFLGDGLRDEEHSAKVPPHLGRSS
jgi:hypothetical protein